MQPRAFPQNPPTPHFLAHRSGCVQPSHTGSPNIYLHDGRVVYAKGNDHIIDAVRCALLMREQANLDQVGEETVSLVPVMTDPVFV